MFFIPDWDLGFCGLNCGCCSLRTDHRCNGCHSPINGIHWSPDCTFIPCAARHHVKYCFECEDFPCVILLSFASNGHSHHHITVENLKMMKQEGLNSWKKRWTTPSFCPGWTEE